ncbi:ryncolin-1 [Drosophila biarmipes]|uniref:ryncolin-1 n=1 Tax=Drosophila biarmipes TaxID=125945 RepID=UPI0007E85BAC|nr:ryncolin-1 [Drosophila biarmipes]
MLLLGVLFSLVFSSAIAIENETEFITNGTDVCTCAPKSELAEVREEQQRQAVILEGLAKNFVSFVTNTYPTSCAESSNSSKLLVRLPEYSAYPFEVTCDQESHGGGWTVFLRRNDGSQDFYLGWEDYQKGFGDLDNEFFMGLDKLHALTASEPQELLVILADFNGSAGYARYDSFKIGPESNNYTMESLGLYSGNFGDSLSRHRSMQFSTKDRDNDLWGGNCAESFTGAWWFGNCLDSDLCGLYGEDQGNGGITWWNFESNWNNMKHAVMLIRPLSSAS